MSPVSDSLQKVNGKDVGSTNGIGSRGGSPEPKLDITKLHSLPYEQQDLHLLTFVSNLENRIELLDHDGICALEAYLVKELFQVISLSNPAPTRVIRTSLGRSFEAILRKGDRKPLYESINDLLAILNAGKGERELKSKHAAVYCLGEIFQTARDSAFSLTGVTCSSLAKVLKSASNHAGLRAAVFTALSKVVKGVHNVIDETSARDIWKLARLAASGDKASLVQRTACLCLEQLLTSTPYFDNTSDFETLKTAIWKACDSHLPATRRAAASCLAAILVKAYSENSLEKSIPKMKRTKKSKKQNSAIAEIDEEIIRPDSPTLKPNASRLEFALPDLLRQLSGQYLRSTTTNRARVALSHCYSKVLVALDTRVVESHYSQIADHLLIEVLSSPFVTHHRYRLLLTRKLVLKILAQTVGAKVLGEAGQTNAARLLINNILKNYPQVIRERAEPSKHTLTGALDVLAAQIQSLGSAFNVLSDSCRDALFQVLQSPNYTVQIHASYCLRVFVLACPQQLLPCASICMNSVNRELSLLPDGQSARRCVGYANALAAVLSTSPMHPLYGSLEISSRVLSITIGLLKSSSSVELRVSATQIQVAWILIGGLMALGSNFVKIHLSQLMLMWRNALPKPLTKENTAQRQLVELSYLTHVREYALGSILSFLDFNSRLITTDISRRIATFLLNTIEFLETLPVKKLHDDASQRMASSLSLQDLISMVRRRVLQCYTRLLNLSPLASRDILTQPDLLTWAVLCFADPENVSSGSLGTSIANSSGTFESIWEVGDNHGFGITGCVRGFQIDPLLGQHKATGQSPWFCSNDSEFDEDNLILTPLCGAREYDSIYLLGGAKDEPGELPDPPATEVVNSAIAFFAAVLPLQDAKIQEAVLEQLATLSSSNSLQRNPGRRAAITVNTAMALLAALKVAVGETLAAPGDVRHPAVERCIQEMLHTLVVDQDQYIRNIAYESLGRLCNSSGNSLTTNEVNWLIDTIVSNRDPCARAGCAMALGSIHSYVGGMAAGFHLKKIHSILLSLCSDPHPTVHFWAIESLSQVAESAGLTFSGYVLSTLGLLAQLWTSDSHNEESELLSTSNSEAELPTGAAIAHSINSLINVLGPDLQDMGKARQLMLTLMKQFDVDDGPLVRAESLRCREHFQLYAPMHMNFTKYIWQMQKDLESPHDQIRETAVNGLYNLARRDAEQVFEVAGGTLEDQLWDLLNENPGQEGVCNIIEAWIGQSCLTLTMQWIARFQRVLSKTIAKQDAPDPTITTKTSATADLQDEEIAGFASGDTKEGQSDASDTGQELLKWQVRAFVLKCLSDMIAIIGRDLELDSESRAGNALQQKIADVVRMAFLASTASVLELRVIGLKLIDQVLMIFGSTPDPDFSEALLLEQYQAQISSALTPAFSADSSPELASAAVNVCATFIATGLVTDIERMGRILKLLVGALESFTSDIEESAVGDLRGLSQNAQTMVRMAVLSAWAELQVASRAQEYLIKVLEPYLAKLAPLWLSSLQEFARLRFEPDISRSTGPIGHDESLDVVYAALNRQTLLKFYQDSWLKMVDAIASLIDQDSNFVFDALDHKQLSEANGLTSVKSDIDYREEPVAFFFILFGIAIEALITRPSSDSPTSKEQTLEILHALKKILRPSVSGNAIYQDVVFSETIELFDRLALTEGTEVQTVIVEIARNLCRTHPCAKDEETSEEHLSDDIEQLFSLTRIIIIVLVSLLPNLAEHVAPSRPNLPDEAVPLIRLALSALVDASEIFPSIIRTDLNACILHIFTTVLSTGSCQALVVPQALPILRRFIQSKTSSQSSLSTVGPQIRGTLSRFQVILVAAQRRESESSLPCAKNTLLAITILLTTGSKAINPSDPLLTSLLDALLDCLQDLGLAKVVASCVRSLLLVHPKNGTDEAIARFLMPRLLRFITQTEQQDPENARAMIAHALTTLVATLPAPRIPAALSLVLPALLHRARKEGKEVYAETASRVLELAGMDQMAFRATVRGMGAEMRIFMEGVIREGGGVGRERERVEERGEPSIALKMDFGGVGA